MEGAMIDDFVSLPEWRWPITYSELLRRIQTRKSAHHETRLFSDWSSAVFAAERSAGREVPAGYPNTPLVAQKQTVTSTCPPRPSPQRFRIVLSRVRQEEKTKLRPVAASAFLFSPFSCKHWLVCRSSRPAATSDSYNGIQESSNLVCGPNLLDAIPRSAIFAEWTANAALLASWAHMPSPPATVCQVQVLPAQHDRNYKLST